MSEPSSVKTDCIRDALEMMLHHSSSSERKDLSDRIAVLRKEIDSVNASRRSLAKAASSLEDAKKSLQGSDLEGDLLASLIFCLSIDRLHEEIAALRPDALLEEKAVLQRKLHFLDLRWKIAELLLRKIGGGRGI